MPLIIYIFALCVFAIGFTEFITIGLLTTIAASLHTSISQAGLTVTLYAAGVVIGATLLMPFTTRFARKRILLMAILLFTLGNIIAGLSIHLPMLITARIISGIGHGLFIGVAASVSKQLVSPEKIGSALAVVFSGISIAMSFGVPLSTWISNLLPWQDIFFIIALCGFLGMLGILCLMPNVPLIQPLPSLKKNIAALGNKHLLSAAWITTLTYAGSFTLYAFISPVLTQLTHISIQESSFFLLAYGFGAFFGNVLGGKLTDRLGLEKATLWFICLITLSLIWLGIMTASSIAMLIGCILLGCFTYGIIPPIQARILALAMKYTPESLDIASGMSVAAFNLGLIGGSLLGMLTITYGHLSYLAWVGAVCCVLALLYFMRQTRKT